MYIYVYICTCMYIHMLICAYIYMYTCMNIYIYMHIYTYFIYVRTPVRTNKDMCKDI